MLDERKRKILQAVVNDYVSTAEPIGSRTIAKKYDIGLSPATIRNEMSDLEEMGYLYQPHTSAGRVPSDKGYRFYVDELMDTRSLTQEEINIIKSMLIDNCFTALDQIMKETTFLLSMLTHYTTIALVPSIKKHTIKHIQIIPLDLDNGMALLVIVTGSGIVRNNLIRLPQAVNDDFIIRFSNILSEKLRDLTIENITLPIIQDIRNEMVQNEDILMPILDIISQSINNIEDNDVYLGGTSNILDYPEYSDIGKAREFLGIIETKETIYKLLGQNNTEAIKISIGKENFIEEMGDCSLVSTTYSVGSKTIGTVGIIGPKRMDYSKVVSIMNNIRKYLCDVFENWMFK